MLKLLTISIFIIVVGAIGIDRLGKGFVEPSSVIYDIENSKQLFAEFVEKYNKEYEREEYNYRYEIFVKNLEDINERNKQSSSAVYGITKFVDLTHEEFISMYTGMAVSGRRSDDDDTPVDVDTLLDNIQAPEEFDWRDKNVVTDVKDQQSCGSCWAFSSTGAAEGQYAIQHSELLSLSEKQLIDCWDQSGGCILGNSPHRGLNAAAKMGGFMLERDYPYKPTQEKCSFQKNKVAVRVKGGHTVAVNDEEKLKHLVYQIGPISTGFYATEDFSSYRGQIYHGKGCPKGKDPNHAMLIVGYGVENGTPYWIIKNSYNVHWGANGYLKLIRGMNACSLLNYTAVAEVE